MPNSFKSNSPRLFVDLVPKSAWTSNVRSEVTETEWKDCARVIYKYFKYRCDACQGWGPNHPVECHERWEYDERRNIQKLVDLVALCPDCHEATHYGYASIRGREGFAREQLMRVNGWSERQLDKHLAEAYETWERRSRKNWILDATFFLGVRIPISDETRIRILDLARGIAPREIPVPQDLTDAPRSTSSAKTRVADRASKPAPAPKKPSLSADLKKAVDYFGLDNDRAADAIGVTRSRIADLHVVGIEINPESEEGRAAIRLIDLHRAISAKFSTRDSMRAWFLAEDESLGGRPIDLICDAQNPQGVDRVRKKFA